MQKSKIKDQNDNLKIKKKTNVENTDEKVATLKNRSIKKNTENKKTAKEVKSEDLPVGKAGLIVKSGEVKKTSKNTREPETMEELLAQTGYQLKGYKRGEIVEGTISSITPREVLIDLGAKTEGIVAEKEMFLMRDMLTTMKIGDKIRGMIISTENDLGQMVLSLRKAGMDLRWKQMEEAMKNKEPVEVTGAEVNKGGLIVTTEGLRGFVPSSQMAYGHGGKATELINRRISVIVIEVNQSQNRLIFSEKALGGRAQKEGKKELLAKIKIGDSYDGKVTGVVPYGLFINIGGLDGLVHISEIAWEKVNTPADYYKTGDKVKVVVLGIEESSGKLNLSIKQLALDPWKEAAKKYATSQRVKGKVTRVSTFGVFVSLEAGIEGLIHISKVPPGKEFFAGEELECTIELVDGEKRRISLAPVLTVKPVGYK